MTFEEWWYSKEVERGDEGINTSINTIKNLARQSWEAAQSEIKKQLEFEKEKAEGQRLNWRFQPSSYYDS